MHQSEEMNSSHMRFEGGTAVRGVPRTTASQYLEAADFDARSVRTMTQAGYPQPLLGNIPEAERSMRIQGSGLGDLTDPHQPQYGVHDPYLASDHGRYGAGPQHRREMSAAEYAASAHAQGYGRFNTE